MILTPYLDARANDFKFEHFTVEQGVSHDTISYVLQERQDLLWFGTWGGGTNKLDKGKVNLPPFWQTWWFKLLVLLAVLAIIYALFRLRIRGVKTQKATLEKLVSQRTAELFKRQKELEEARDIAESQRQAAELANRSKTEFLARMSHDIRTPMNSIIGFTDMLLDTELNEEQQDYSGIINRSGQALLALLNDILDASKIESGQLALDSIDFDPEVTAFDVCELIHPRVGNKPIEILCRIGDNVPAYVNGDPGRFRQVLVNLMGNAVKFTDKGEVELSIDVEEKKKTTVKLHARVRDTGIGIAGDKLESVFEAFRQVNGSTGRNFEGSGLGLAICKQIAKLMGGDIRVESKPGKGSIFHFTAVLEKSKNKPARREVPTSLTGKKILIVDDNKHNLEILTHLLTGAGMQVKVFSRGEDVVPAIQKSIKDQTPFDLGILDIRMPGLNGCDVAKMIHRLPPPACNLPLLAFSSSITRRSKAFMEAKFDGFLPKPIQGTKLLNMIEKLLVNGKRPKAKGKREPLATRYSLDDEAKHSVRILLAEDNPINQKLARAMLARAGYKVKVVNNGKEAVEAYSADPHGFDLIFMDIQMPEMDGIAATQEIREYEKKISRNSENNCRSVGPAAQGIPIVAMTAQTMKGDRERFLEAGMDDFISKPIKREVVFEKAKKWALGEEITINGNGKK